MKTINSFRSKLLALTLALMASVSTFAYDYHGDLLCYNVLTDSTVAVTGQSEYKTMPRYEYLPENLVIPAEVTLQGKTYKVVSIDQWAFYACTMLKSVTIPSSVTFIGLSAFQYCEKLVNVDIPTSVTTVEGSAFSYTKWYDNLPDGEVYINNTLYRYKGTAPENTQIVVKDGTTRIAGFTFWNQSNIVSIELPQSLTVIEQCAFEGCTQLSSILIPKNVTFIGCSAFAKCTGLMEVICLAPTPPIAGVSANPSPSDWMFAGVEVSKIPLYVPAESIDLYKEAEQWMFFNPILPIEPTSYKSQWCDTWNVLELKYRYSSYTTKEDFETWRYYLAQDTIINNYTYTAVTRQTTKVPEGVYPFTIPEPEYVAAVRFTDDRKVYIYYDNTEYLLYDFNVQPGDELTVFAGINHYHSHHTNTIRVDEVERYPGIYPFGTEISLSVFPDFYGDERPACFGVTKWVEGVGDLCGFITGADCGLSEYQTALLCAYKDGNTEYRTEYEEYAEYGCEYNSGENKEYILTLPGLQRTVCNEYCEDSKTSLQKFEDILFEHDKPYIYCESAFLIREENNKILIYSHSLDKDLVLYDFTLEVGDSLPRLYLDESAEKDLYWIYYNIMNVVDYHKDLEGNILPADTLIVTDVSAITLLDGKEYKKWTFNNGMEYVEGIGSFGNNMRFFDFFQLIGNMAVPVSLHGTHLVCVSKNNKLLYQMDDAELERLNTECLCDGYQSSYKDQWCDTWNVLYHGWDPEGGDDPYMPYTFIYQLEEDTTINDLTYQRLTGRFSLSTMPSNKEYVAALRFAENKKVFVHYDNTEYLLYDFGAQVGDTLEIFGGIDHYKDFKTLTHVITEIDSLDDGRLQIYSNAIIQESEGYETPFERLYPKIWIEGVGSKDGIVQNSATNRIGIGPCVLLCAYHNDDCIYTTDNPYYTPYGCVHNDSFFTATEEVNAPTQSVQKIMYNGQLLILRDGKIYNIMGVELTK